jgi:hypothetical protein
MTAQPGRRDGRRERRESEPGSSPSCIDPKASPAAAADGGGRRGWEWTEEGEEAILISESSGKAPIRRLCCQDGEKGREGKEGSLPLSLLLLRYGSIASNYEQGRRRRRRTEAKLFEKAAAKADMRL